MFHSYALNRDFTEDEWLTFIRRLSPHDVVAEHFGYKYNCHDVCLNPTIIADNAIGRTSFKAEIFHAPNGKWGYHVSVNTANPSTSTSSFIGRDESLYDSEESASREALLYAKKELSRYAGQHFLSADSRTPSNNNERECNSLCKQIDRHLQALESKQLTLF